MPTDYEVEMYALTERIAKSTERIAAALEKANELHINVIGLEYGQWAVPEP